MRLRFIRPDWRITLVTVFFCGVFVVAGQWQDRRAAYKAQLQERVDRLAKLPPVSLTGTMVDPAEYERMPVSATGSYDPKYTLLIDNKVYKGRVGYQVYTPLRIGGSDLHILVDRGWIAQGRTREDLPAVMTPAGVQRVTGTAVPFPGHHLELKAQSAGGPVWQNIDAERYRAWSGLKLQPLVLEQSDTFDDGLTRERVRPDFGIEKHRIYALQWYSFFVLAIVLYAVLHIKRKSAE
jgi:surfeit locus 1 family protein